MKLLLILFSGLLSTSAIANECSPLLDFDVKALAGKDSINLCKAYQGKVLLVVNTASRCAYTDQYDSLEKLYRKYRDDGLVVLGFPSNDFGNQEPGSEQQIKRFCKMTYNVQFPMFSKTRVSKRNADPFYQRLAEISGTYPRWNFHKYLIDRDGQLAGSYSSAIDPLDESLTRAIETQIKKL